MPPKYSRVERIARRSLRDKTGRNYRAYLFARRVVRVFANKIGGAHLGWVAWLQGAHWVSQTTYEISGWAFERGYGSNDVKPKIMILLYEPNKRRPILSVPAQIRYDTDANTKSRLSLVDYGAFAFTAQLELGELLTQNVPSPWRVEVQVDSGDHKAKGPFVELLEIASARYLNATTVGNSQIRPRWSNKNGLSFSVVTPTAFVTSQQLTGRNLQLNIQLPEAATVPKIAKLSAANHNIALQIEPAAVRADTEPATNPDTETGTGWALRGTLPPLGILPAAENGDLVLPKNDPETVGDALEVRKYQLVIDGKVAAGRKGDWQLCDTETSLLVTTAELMQEPFGINVTGQCIGAGAGDVELLLTGPRNDLPAQTSWEGPDFTAFIPLLHSVWGGAKLPPIVGNYVLRARDGAGVWVRVQASDELLESLPIREKTEWLNWRIASAEGHRIAFLLTAPLKDDEYGDYNQQRMKRQYHSSEHTPWEGVYFESFNGRSATDNPLALDRVVAKQFPHLPRYWGVVDRSVAVPPGAIPVVWGTKQWWEARFGCRWLIINEWIRQKYQHQPFQIVLQTWHGSMFKRIGLDRPNFSEDEKYWLRLEQSKWDILLSQNLHSTEIFRSAYAWDRPIWEEGYPRNDSLSTGDGQAIRELLGIRPEQKAILYAPTWREANEGELVEFLDLEQMAKSLGENYVLLLRGHSRTLLVSSNVRVSGVIDVTSYPHVSDIFLASDAMITDYSSVMFDFSVTGKPMIFFTPDLDQYRDQSRGVYFDLEELAPGPVCYTQQAVLDAIKSIDADRSQYADRYTQWQQRFNAHDDGYSAERVVERLFALPKP